MVGSARMNVELRMDNLTRVSPESHTGGSLRLWRDGNCDRVRFNKVCPGRA